jgi:TrmH family RNA methyltransferase
MPIKITSPSNPLVKSLKSLHAKKARAESGLFLAEGARLAAEAADLGIWPEIMAISSAAWKRSPVERLIAQAEAAGVRVLETSETVLEQISKRDNPQTVIGAYRHLDRPLSTLELGRLPLVVALEGVRDPGNLGTIVRTADAVGADAVILLDQTCDPFSVEAVRATMGSIFAIPLARASFTDFDAWRRGSGLTMVGASLNGAAMLAPEVARAPLAVLMGNEQSGLNGAMEAACDFLVRLPMRGRADSLNLAIATGVLLYDAWRARDFAGARA